MAEPLSWRRNQFAVTAASFVGFTGFTLVMPFLPLYIRTLGVSDVGEIAMWAGLSLGVTPAVTAALSPFWGRVADRYGRKIMVQRSLVSFVVIMAVTAWVTRPWHIFALRAIQGIFAGYGGLTMAMAAESAPPERLARAIGLVQTAQRIGPAVGPVIGGLVAGLVGLRGAFYVTSALYFVALVLVTVWYRDPHRHAPNTAVRAAAPGKAWLRSPQFVLMLAAIFLLTFVDRSLGPILPLWVDTRGLSGRGVALVSGVLFSAVAFGAAFGNHLCELWLRRRTAAHVISAATIAAAAALVAFLANASVLWMGTTMAVLGVALGAALTAGYTEGGAQVPREAHGEGFGYLIGANLAGLALGPVVAGFLSRRALLWVFVVDVVVLAVVILLLRRTPASRR
jgi:MFS transporter, DHA1 family, multidrug resistance protein